jgi:hypothetical protein
MDVLLTIAFGVVVAIARMALSTARLFRICPVLRIIILIDYLITIQLSNSQEVT